VQQFNQVAVFIKENIDRSVHWVSLHLAAYQAGEAVEAFAHVGRLLVQKETVGTGQAKHYTRWIRARIVAIEPLAGRVTFTPLG